MISAFEPDPGGKTVGSGGSASPAEESRADTFASPIASFILDEKGIIREVNWGGELLLGLSSKDLVGSPLHRYSDAESISAFMSHLKEAATGKRTVRCEMMLRNFATLMRIEAILESTLIHSEAEEKRIRTFVFDVSERKRLIHALLYSDRRLRALIKASSDVLYRMSADWNRMLQLSGGGFIPDTDEPSGSWLDKYIPPEDQPEIKRAIDEAIRTKSIFELEHRVRRTDGSWGWTFSRAVPLLDPGGKIIEWYGAATDITQRKEAQEALKAKNTLLEIAMAATNAGWANWDWITGLTDWSECGKSIMGFETDGEARTVEGWLSRIHPEDRPKVQAHARQAAAEHRDFDIEYRIIHQGGEIRWLLGRGRIIYDREGSPVSSTGLIVDITEIKEAEEKLRSSKEVFSKAFARSAAAMSIIRLNDRRYLEVNDAWIEMFGFRREEVVERTIEEIDLWQSREDRDRMDALLRQTGSVRELEVALRKNSGEKIVVLLSAEVIAMAGVQVLLTSALDITRTRKQPSHR